MLTPHFDLAEFASHDGEPYPADWVEPRLLPLCRVLEHIRTACGDHPLVVTSGYRSPAHNAAVGGAARSRHMAGDAADIAVAGVSPRQVHAVAQTLHAAGAIRLGGLGLYSRWVHVDLRPGALVTWTG